MPIHRNQVQGYGLPLPPNTGRRLGSRAPKIPGILARQIHAQPRRPQQPGQVPKRLPRTRKVQELETSNPREIMGLISAYAKGRRTVVLSYRKATENMRLVIREVEPYSIRIKNGRRYFYGFCLPHGEIHCFLVDNIQGVRGTSRRYVPRWRIEL